jgi:glycosyltransferase involved in cell wall biosynthesis
MNLSTFTKFFSSTREQDSIDEFAEYLSKRLGVNKISYIGKFKKLKLQEGFSEVEYYPSRDPKNLNQKDFSNSVVVTDKNTVQLQDTAPFVLSVDEDPKIHTSYDTNLFGYDIETGKRLIRLGGKFAKFHKPEKTLRVLAIMTNYNEGDIVEKVIEHMLSQGLDVHAIDNWSTDGSYELIVEIQKRFPGRIQIERFPESGPEQFYEWKKLLGRVEEVALNSNYDWCIHHDSDEIRKSPWPELTIVEAISLIDSMGFNAIDHTVLNFKPIKDGFSSENNPEDFFKYFEINTHPGYFLQNKGWKNIPGQRVDLQFTGGHDVTFPGRKVFPLKFLLKHYSIRSNIQANTKIFKNRLPRISEREKDFNDHYKVLAEQKNFIMDKSELNFFDDKTFNEKWMIQRLSGVGLR